MTLKEGRLVGKVALVTGPSTHILISILLFKSILTSLQADARDSVPQSRNCSRTKAPES